MDRATAETLYYEDYWQPERYHDIRASSVMTKLFDLAVNMGRRRAHRMIQRALRSVGYRVKEDGLLGPKTLSAINRAESHRLLAALKSEAAGYYRSLAIKRPKQRKFLNGWLNRAYA